MWIEWLQGKRNVTMKFEMSARNLRSEKKILFVAMVVGKFTAHIGLQTNQYRVLRSVHTHNLRIEPMSRGYMTHSCNRDNQTLMHCVQSKTR